MIAWLVTATLLSAAPSDAPPERTFVLVTEVLERVPLPVLPRAVSFDVWQREVRLTTPRAAAVARALAGSRLCPKVAVRDGAVVARCRNGQLLVTVERRGRGAELAIAQLRGLPRDDPRSLGTAWHYPPERFGLGGACPGTTPEGKAECLIAEGRLDDAVPLLDRARQHGNGDFAALRLGDVALAKGDTLGAFAHYEAAGQKNSWGRLAAMRLCELNGCEREVSVFDSARLAEPLATEVELRLARALALRGEDRLAAQTLEARLADQRRPPLCPAWPAVCAGVALASLRSGDQALEALGLELFLRQQQELGMTKDTVLLRAAAEAAAELGAPAFAANLLATATPVVPRAHLREHLARVASFYDAAGDRLRAGVVRDYARLVLQRPLRVRGPAPAPAEPPVSALQEKLGVTLAQAAATLELADAAAIVGRARAAAVLGASAVMTWGPDAGTLADDADPLAGAPDGGAFDAPDAGDDASGTGPAAPASGP